MSLKLSISIQGMGDAEPVTVSLCGNGHEPVDPQKLTGRMLLDDPSDSLGLMEPDDPSDSLGLMEPDDPSDSLGLMEPDDPRSSPAAGYSDAPGGCGPRRLDVSQRGRWGRPSPAMVSASRPTPRPSGFVIVVLSPLVPRTNHVDLFRMARRQGLDGLKQVLKRFHKPPSERAITTPRAGEPGAEEPQQCKGQESPQVSLEDLERRAARNGLGPRNSLRRYWRVAGPTKAPNLKWGKGATPEGGLGYSAAELAQSFVEQLNALSEVDLAYLELAASDPDALEGAPSAEELSNFQFYLDPSPLGLDARWARNRLNGISEDDKIAVADLEQGWILDHEDLAPPAELIHGENRHGVGDYRGHHGAAVLSELVAKEGNELGIVGIASGASRVVVASHYRSEGTTELASNSRVADAIVALMTGENPPLKAGDVLLLEVQKGGLPTEVEPLDFDAIRLATANGIIVVEAAGNGGFDLDRLARTEDGRSFHRQHIDFRDSGAIMVGAARAAAPHNRAPFSNHGSRIDCFGWGDSVVAAGYGDYLGGDGDREIYTDKFSGTSAAAPMIAGAAILVQSLYRAEAAPKMVDDESWKRLSPRQMRSLLSNPKNGTPQGPRVRGHIGVMPDLRAILDEALGIVPRVYLRDHEGDTGQIPYRRRTCASPDIIVTNGGASAADFGEGSGTENDQSLGLGLVPGGKRHLFVRMRNRGLQPAEETRVTVYSAPISTLITPDRWTEVGQTELNVVSQGDTLKVSEVNFKGNIEDCCLVAVAEHRGGTEAPVKCPASHFGWRRYLAMMQTQGNVAVRNVHTLKSGPLCEFIINGTPDAPRAFEFEVVQRLPIDVTVRLTTKVGLALKFSHGRLWSVHRDHSAGDNVTLHLPKQPRFRLGSVTLPAGVPFPGQFELMGTGLGAGHSLAIRQLYRGQEVGRITWRF